jgi:hypothetical protein
MPFTSMKNCFKWDRKPTHGGHQLAEKKTPKQGRECNESIDAYSKRGSSFIRPRFFYKDEPKRSKIEGVSTSKDE